MQRNKTVTILLTAALTLVFLVFGIEKFTDSYLWIGFMPPWLEGVAGLTRDVWLRVFGAIEILLAVLIVIPRRKTRLIGTGLIILHLIGVLTQVGWNDVGVRDIAILLSAVALMILL